MEQVYDTEREKIQNMAISTRGANAEDFTAFIKSFDKKIEEDTDEIHKLNMNILNQKM